VRVGVNPIACWQARRARTQRQMNLLWKRPGDLYIAFRQQLVSKWIVLGLMFSPVVPALLPLIFLFLFIANWVRFSFVVLITYMFRSYYY